MTLGGATSVKIYGCAGAGTTYYFIDELFDLTSSFDIYTMPNSGATPPGSNQIDLGPPQFRIRCRLESTQTEQMITDPTVFADARLTFTVPSLASGALANDTYYVVYTLENSWVDVLGRTIVGETAKSPEAQITVTGGSNNAHIDVKLTVGNSKPEELSAHALRANIYITSNSRQSGGGKNWLKVGTIEAGQTSLRILSMPALTAAQAPWYNTTGTFSVVTPQVARLRVMLHDTP
jgi:hypothetical protein